MDLTMNKFYIGQKIVAIKDHSQGVFKKGDEFTVLGIDNCCGEYLYINIYVYGTICECNYERDGAGFNSELFAPVELSTTTFEYIIKKHEPCLN